MLTADDRDDDGIPLLHPISCGRDGQAPLVIRLPSLRDEAVTIAELMGAAHQEGRAWGEMAIICRHYAVMDACAAALRQPKLPHQMRKGTRSFDPGADTIKVLTMHASKGLEFAVVALPGIGRMPEAGYSEAEEARLFYVAATRATHLLYITLSGEGAYMDRFPA